MIRALLINDCKNAKAKGSSSRLEKCLPKTPTPQRQCRGPLLRKETSAGSGEPPLHAHALSTESKTPEVQYHRIDASWPGRNSWDWPGEEPFPIRLEHKAAKYSGVFLGVGGGGGWVKYTYFLWYPGDENKY